MPETAQSGQGPGEPVPSGQPVPAAQPRRGGMFRDPMVKAMGLAAAGLVILFLALVAGALLTGVAAPTGPRTVEEKQVAVSEAAIRSGTKDPAVWGEYISALVANGDYGLAEDAITQAKQTVVDSSTADIPVAEARLFAAQKKYAQAIKAADGAMKSIKATYDKIVKAGGTTAKMERVVGLPENYYNAALIKAYAYRDMKDWKNAIKAYDIYIGHTVGASDVLVDRARAKVEAGDKAGAAKDYRAALKFVPDDKEALEGLKKIGASK